jgi:hypothetical protein
MDRVKFTSDNGIIDRVDHAKAYIASRFTEPKPSTSSHRHRIAPPESVARSVGTKIRNRLYTTGKHDGEKNALARVLRTVDYMLINFRRVMYISIRDGKIAMMLCLRNRSGPNPFTSLLKPLDEKTKDYVLRHLQSNPDGMQDPTYNPVESWLVTGCLIANVLKKKPLEQTGYEMGHSHGEMKRLFEATCKMYKIPDCDFFVNYYDQIVLHNDVMVPFMTATDGRKIPMPHAKRYVDQGLSHILSTSSHADYADVPFVFTDDVQRIFRSYGIPKCDNPYVDYSSYELVWSNKIAKAVFRGSATGCGWTAETNQRIAVAHLASTKWARDARYKDLFDVALTRKDYVRFKKNIGEPVRFYVDPRVERMPEKILTMAEQSRYKYLLYIEGNVVAYRLTAMFGMGSVVIYVKGQYEPWFYGMLRHRHNCIMVNHVNALPDAIAWCVKNDETCKTIAERGYEMYKTLFSKRGILGYVAWTLRTLSTVKGSS